MDRLDLVILATLIALLVGHDVAVSGWVPTGADAGNWLAIAREAMGIDAMSAEVSYPPVLPSLLGGLFLVAGPLPAIATVDIIAKAALASAVYIVAAPVGRIYAASATVLVGLSGAHLEAFSWGAYPQLIATGIAFMAVLLLIRFMESRRPAHLTVAVLLSALVATTHLLIAGLLVMAIPLAILHWLWLARIHWREWVRRSWSGALVVIPSVLYPTGYLLFSTPQDPVVNPEEMTRATSLIETFKEAGPLWAIVAMLAAGALFWRGWPHSQRPTIAVSSSWMIAGTVFFLIVAERRSLLPAQVALVVLAVAAFRRIYVTFSVERSRGVILPARRLRSMAVITLGVALISGIVAASMSAFPATTEWYRVVDVDELEGLELLAAADEDAVVVASRGNSGIQVGWWIEGYVGIPTYSGLDTRFLAFEEEREQAEIANAIFSAELSESRTWSLLDEIGADFLVVDRRGPDADWLTSSFASSLPVVYDSDTLVILSVSSDRGGWMSPPGSGARSEVAPAA